MAQEPRRDRPVRLPNPSAQPFVAALKTARLFAVVFFWITMACILSYVVVFILTEWIGLYDAPLAPAAPVESKAPAEPKGPAAPKGLAAPTKEDAPAPEPGSASWLGLFENTAQAATKKNGPPTFFDVPATRRGETPPEGSSEESTEETPEVGPSSTSPPTSLPPETPTVATPKEETSGKVIARPETPPTERRAPTLEEQRERVEKYKNVTANLLKPLRVVGLLASFMLGATLFIYLQIALLGRLAGIRQLTAALFMLVIFVAFVLPWNDWYKDIGFNAFYDFDKLLTAHADRLAGKDVVWHKEALFYIRFFCLPLLSTFLLIWSGIQFAAGYRASVVANE